MFVFVCIRTHTQIDEVGDDCGDEDRDADVDAEMG